MGSGCCRRAGVGRAGAEARRCCRFLKAGRVALGMISRWPHHPNAIARSRFPFAVGSCITDGYWFTASAALANPAVTIARTLARPSFSGIRATDVPAFIFAQCIGSANATPICTGWIQQFHRVPRTWSYRGYSTPLRRLAYDQQGDFRLPTTAPAARRQRRSSVSTAANALRRSAGLESGTQNPLEVEVMRERGIDISKNARQERRLNFKNRHILRVCNHCLR